MDYPLSEVQKVEDGWMQKIGNSDRGLIWITDYQKSRRPKMAGCRRSEIQMEVYDGLPIIRSPEGRRWLDAEDRKFRWRSTMDYRL